MERGVVEEEPDRVRRLPRAQRREQILAAATEAFARSGFAATSLDDLATEAGITRVLLYRHFDSKTDRYQAVLDRMCARLDAHVEQPVGGFTDAGVDGLLAAAVESPAVSGCCSSTLRASRGSPSASTSSGYGDRRDAPGPGPEWALLLLDHIGSTWPPIYAAQWLLERLTIRLAGEHFTRRQLPFVRAAGFEIVETERFKAGTVERVFARKRAAKAPAA